MKKTVYQRPEIRDENDSIIQEGTYGKNSPLVNADNTGAFDYINNNLEYLKETSATTTQDLRQEITTAQQDLRQEITTAQQDLRQEITTAIAEVVETKTLTVTGETSVPTANEGNSSKAIANTEFVAKSIAALVNGAPDQLNTLNELAKALGNDSNFAATVTAELAKKLNSTEAESTYATKAEAGVPYQIKRNTAYKVGDVLTSPSLPPGCVIVVTQAGTTGSTEPDWTTIKSNMGG